MAPPPPPSDDSEALLASLADLGNRIEAARGGDPSGAPAPRRRGAVVLGLAALVIAVLVGVLAIGGNDDDERDVAAGEASAQVTTSTAAPSTTAAPATTAAPVTTAAPATTAAPPTTQAPATTAAPTTEAYTTAPPTTAPPTTAPPVAEPVGQPDPAPGDVPRADPGEWTVVAGDSFWSVAERLAADQLGHPATDAEVTPVWADLVAANADRLVEPGNPDLILPGQTMVLPATLASP